MNRSWFAFVSLILLTRFEICTGVELKISKSMPVISQPLVFTYTSDSKITLEITFKLDGITKGRCYQDGGDCGASDGCNVTRQSDTAITLEISSFETQYAGTWTVLEGTPITATMELKAPFATVVDKSQINFKNACPSTNNSDVRIITNCFYPVVKMSWVVLDKIYPADITNDSTECTNSQVKTTASLSLDGKSIHDTVNVTVNMTHPSFDNEVYEKFICIAEFPGAETSTTITSTLPKPIGCASCDTTCIWIVVGVSLGEIAIIIIIVTVVICRRKQRQTTCDAPTHNEVFDEEKLVSRGHETVQLSNKTAEVSPDTKSGSGDASVTNTSYDKDTDGTVGSTNNIFDSHESSVDKSGCGDAKNAQNVKEKPEEKADSAVKERGPHETKITVTK